jgi:AcrR family transcriptional regulator
MTTVPLRGRQAEALNNDRAVVDAARRVFAVHGPDAPVSAVAAEAGVGIGSLYRRYPSKEALLVYVCLESMRQQEAAAQRGLEVDDPWDGLCRFVHECVSFRAGVFGATVAGALESTDELRRAAKKANDQVTLLMARAQDAGALRPGVTAIDLLLLIELFSRRRLDDDGAHQRLLVIALDGLSSTGPATDMPVAAVGWSAYVGRWKR